MERIPLCYAAEKGGDNRRFKACGLFSRSISVRQAHLPVRAWPSTATLQQTPGPDGAIVFLLAPNILEMQARYSYAFERVSAFFGIFYDPYGELRIISARMFTSLYSTCSVRVA